MLEIQEREMSKRISIYGVSESVVDGQIIKDENRDPIIRWAHMYTKIGTETDKENRQTGIERIHWTLRKDTTLFDIKGIVRYDKKSYDIISVRELSNWQMQIICKVIF